MALKTKISCSLLHSITEQRTNNQSKIVESNKTRNDLILYQQWSSHLCLEMPLPIPTVKTLKF